MKKIKYSKYTAIFIILFSLYAPIAEAQSFYDYSGRQTISWSSETSSENIYRDYNYYDTTGENEYYSTPEYMDYTENMYSSPRVYDITETNSFYGEENGYSYATDNIDTFEDTYYDYEENTDGNYNSNDNYDDEINRLGNADLGANVDEFCTQTNQGVQLKNCRAENITGTGAMFVWESYAQDRITPVKADSYVYGNKISGSGFFGTVQLDKDSKRVFEHRIFISNQLTPGTKYRFSIVSNSADHGGQANDLEFSTPGINSGILAPLISRVNVNNNTSFQETLDVPIVVVGPDSNGLNIEVEGFIRQTGTGLKKFDSKVLYGVPAYPAEQSVNLRLNPANLENMTSGNYTIYITAKVSGSIYSSNWETRNIIFTGVGGNTTNNPQFDQSGITNLGSFNTANSHNAIAPGTVLAIFGNNLTANGNTCTYTSFPLPRELCGTKVFVNVNGTDIQAPLFQASKNQINFQLPYEARINNNVTIRVQNMNNNSSGTVNITPEEFALGIFTYNSTRNGHAIAFHAVNGNTQLISTGSDMGRNLKPAVPGEKITVFFTGGGNDTANSSQNGVATPTTGPTYTLNGTANVYFRTQTSTRTITAEARKTPGLVGVDQFSFNVPLDITDDTYTISFGLDSYLSQETKLLVKRDTTTPINQDTTPICIQSQITAGKIFSDACVASRTIDTRPGIDPRDGGRIVLPGAI